MFPWEGTALLDREDVLLRLSVSRTRRKYKGKSQNRLSAVVPNCVLLLIPPPPQDGAAAVAGAGESLCGCSTGA